MYYLDQKLERHYWVDMNELLVSSEIFSNKKVSNYFVKERNEYVARLGEVVIHFSNHWNKEIREIINKKYFKLSAKRNTEEDFAKIKEISKRVDESLGHCVYCLVSTYKAIKETIEIEDLLGNKRFKISKKGANILLELFKELTVPQAQNILDKKLEESGILKEVSDLKMLNIPINSKKTKNIKDSFSKIWIYVLYSKLNKEKIIFRMLYLKIFKSMNTENSWKSKLRDSSEIKLTELEIIENNKLEINKLKIYFESKGITDKSEMLLNDQEIEYAKKEYAEEILEIDEEDIKNNIMVKLPMVLEYKGQQRITKFIPRNIPVLKGKNNMLMSKDAAKIQFNSIESNNPNKLFSFYKRIDIEKLLNDYPVYKKEILIWFKKQKTFNAWFNKNELSKLGKTKTFNNFSWDTQNKNNIGALIAPACNIKGLNHLSWIGLTANIYENITGDYGKRCVSNAILKSTKFKLSEIDFNKVALDLKSLNITEKQITSSLAWVLQANEFEDDLTTIGEGCLITNKANENLTKQMKEKELKTNQPVKLFFEGYGEKALAYAYSKIKVIKYAGTDKKVFKEELKNEYVSFVKGYTDRENKEAIVASGRRRANKILKNIDSIKSILVDAYDEKGNIIYKNANLHLHKMFIDVTMDRSVKIINQKMSSKQAEELSFNSNRTILDYSKFKDFANERNKTSIAILNNAYLAFENSIPIPNKHSTAVKDKVKKGNYYFMESIEEIENIMNSDITFHGIKFKLPKYHELIPKLGLVYNNILSFVQDRINDIVDERQMHEDIEYVLSELEEMYEREKDVFVPMVRSRLAIKENLVLNEMHVSEEVLSCLIKEYSYELYEEYKKLSTEKFLNKYKITVYSVRFPDFGYSGDYNLTKVDEALNYTSAVSTINSRLIGGDIDDDVLQSKIVKVERR